MHVFVNTFIALAGCNLLKGQSNKTISVVKDEELVKGVRKKEKQNWHFSVVTMNRSSLKQQSRQEIVFIFLSLPFVV